MYRQLNIGGRCGNRSVERFTCPSSRWNRWIKDAGKLFFFHPGFRRTHQAGPGKCNEAKNAHPPRGIFVCIYCAPLPSLGIEFGGKEGNETNADRSFRSCRALCDARENPSLKKGIYEKKTEGDRGGGEKKRKKKKEKRARQLAVATTALVVGHT